MGGKNGIVLPTSNHIILYNLSLRFLLLTHQVGLELKPWILFGETPKVSPKNTMIYAIYIQSNKNVLACIAVWS